jgi:hypothetical protein
MAITLQHPIRSLPCVAPGSGLTYDAEIEVVAMTRSLIAIWRKHVQVWIDNHYIHWKKGADERDVRADVGWNWFRNYTLAAMHNVATKVPGSKSDVAWAWCIVVSDTSAKQFPIGMLTVVPKFYSNVANDNRQRTFAWYLSDAPSEIYDKVLKVDPVRGVATALLDTAIQSGLDLGADGTLLLHADPAAGPKLVRFYTGRCEMKPLSASNPAVSIIRRWNPEEYFVMDAGKAATFCAKYDLRR